MEQRLKETPLPARVPLDVAVRLRGVAPDAPVARPAAPTRSVGETDEFWIVDQGSARTFRVPATLQLVTDNTYWYVQNDYLPRIPQSDLARAARFFEDTTYPTVRRYFGPQPGLGVDGDPHIVFFLGAVPGVAAYFSGADSFPAAINPRSNERDMIYVNLDAIRPGTVGFDSTLAHEFQHMTQFNRCPIQETWLDEGAAELAPRVVGFRGGRLGQFANRPDVQLTGWTDQPNETPRHYQASYLFLRYLVDQFGGFDAIPDLFQDCQRGEEQIQRFLDRRASPKSFDQVFLDWATANLLGDPGLDGGRFSYQDDTLNTLSTATATLGAPVDAVNPQYSAGYVDLPAGATAVQFQGQAEVPVVAAGTGPYWWSNRADSLDSRLTRSFDLRSVDRATLRFRAWWDTEDQYDFVYLVASRDGVTWEAVPGRYTQPDSAIGNDYGPGWTGRSGGGRDAVWVDEEVDLSRYAGSEVLVRFEYLTDQGYNARGFAVADVQVPEVGFAEQGANPSAWLAEGWTVVDAALPQHWGVRLVQFIAGRTVITDIAVGADGRAAAPLAKADRSVLIVTPTALRTVEPAQFSVLAN